mgnify:CR=1 FL=1
MITLISGNLSLSIPINSIPSIIGIFISVIINQRDIFQHVPIIFRKPVKPDSMGVPGFSPFGDVHMSFRIPPRLDARE